jgi:hypothetical protein
MPAETASSLVSKPHSWKGEKKKKGKRKGKREYNNQGKNKHLNSVEENRRVMMVS